MRRVLLAAALIAGALPSAAGAANFRGTTSQPCASCRRS
jgi:hypothetical protein